MKWRELETSGRSEYHRKAGLKEGDEVEVWLEDEKVIIKPLIDKEKFMNELKGCLETSKIKPLEVKKLWKV
jgi:bifunctional DNA-binding transcriptional regulator/antitoxin component of YhaV-PrlF toxin-antitoxin module